MENIFRIDSPPTRPGTYALRNKTTKQIYIGCSVSLSRRFVEWRGHIGSKDPVYVRNASIGRAIQASGPQDWEFVVIFEGTHEEALEVERTAVRKLRDTNPELLLNGDSSLPDPSTQRSAPPGISSTAKSIVMGPNGPMSHGEIAVALGVTKQAIKKRLSAWRKKGKIKISIEDLLQK